MAPTTKASYKGGFFTMPGTGNFSVTGLGFEPQVVLFFGSNSTTEDTVQTGGVRAMMRGCMAWDQVSSTIKSWCMSPIMHDAVRWEQKPIVCCLDGSANTAYEASAVSLDASGFTVNFTVVQSGVKIHWVAIGDMDNVSAQIIGANTGNGNGSYTIDWEPYSGLHLGGLDDTIQDPAGANREASDWGHMLTLGGASWALGYDSGNDSNRVSMWLQITDTPFTDQTRLAQNVGSGSTAYVGMGDHFIGPFMVDGAHQQYPASTTQVQLSVDTDNQGHFVELDQYSDTGGDTPGTNVDDEVTISATFSEIEKPSLILFLSDLDVPSGSNAGPNACMFGFWTKSHQYVVGANGVDGSFYQSSNKSWITNLTTAGVHAGECEALSPGDAVLTTTVASLASTGIIWHMFGRKVGGWVPQIYRRVVPG